MPYASISSNRGSLPPSAKSANAAGLKSPSSVKHQLQVHWNDKGFIRMNANKGEPSSCEVRPMPRFRLGKPAKVNQHHSRGYGFQRIHYGESRDVPLVGTHRRRRANYRRTACGRCHASAATAYRHRQSVHARSARRLHDRRRYLRWRLRWWYANRTPPSTEISSPRCSTTRPR